MNNPDPGKDPAQARSRSLNAILIGALVLVALAVGLYFWGLHQGRGELAAQKAQYEARIGSMQADLQKQTAELAAAGNRISFLQARAAIYRTAVDLDRRNFGTANEHLQEAASFLGKVSGDGAGLDMDRLAAVRKSVSQMNINVATDLETQRDQVLELGSQLDAMMPASPDGK